MTRWRRKRDHLQIHRPSVTSRTSGGAQRLASQSRCRPPPPRAPPGSPRHRGAVPALALPAESGWAVAPPAAPSGAARSVRQEWLPRLSSSVGHPRCRRIPQLRLPQYQSQHRCRRHLRSHCPPPRGAASRRARSRLPRMTAAPGSDRCVAATSGHTLRWQSRLEASIPKRMSVQWVVQAEEAGAPWQTRQASAKVESGTAARCQELTWPRGCNLGTHILHHYCGYQR